MNELELPILHLVRACAFCAYKHYNDTFQWTSEVASEVRKPSFWTIFPFPTIIILKHRNAIITSAVRVDNPTTHFARNRLG